MRRTPRFRSAELLGRLAELGCVVCGMPATIHHTRQGQGMGQRAGDDEAYPLCPYHHQDGPRGEAVQKGWKLWEMKHGLERDHIRRCHQKVGFCSTSRTFVATLR